MPPVEVLTSGTKYELGSVEGHIDYFLIGATRNWCVHYTCGRSGGSNAWCACAENDESLRELRDRVDTCSMHNIYNERCDSNWGVTMLFECLFN